MSMSLPSSPANMRPHEPSATADSPTAPSTLLAHLAVVEVKGADAGSFLQGQLTQDAQSMGPSDARAGGYCSAKGRLLANFVMLHPEAQTWWLIMHASLVESVAKRLKMFVLRAKCTVAVRADLAVFGSLGSTLPAWKVEPVGHDDHPAGAPGPAPEGHTVSPSAQWHIGWWGNRKLVVRHAAGQPHATGTPDGSAWAHADLSAGWPWIELPTVEQFVPQMVNFELLGGVNFRKGCYPGQEVVARSQYRGTLKRRMALFALEGRHDMAPAASTEIFHSEDPNQPAGMVVNAACHAGSEPPCLVLAEVKIAAQVSGTLHLGNPTGPVLSPRALPYRIPTESEM